jgi:hypothetical protein
LYFVSETGLYYYFAVLRFELKAYTLSQSTSPFLVMSFSQDRVWQHYLPRLALNRNLPE